MKYIIGSESLQSRRHLGDHGLFQFNVAILAFQRLIKLDHIYAAVIDILVPGDVRGVQPRNGVDGGKLLCDGGALAVIDASARCISAVYLIDSADAVRHQISLRIDCSDIVYLDRVIKRCEIRVDSRCSYRSCGWHFMTSP